MVLCVQWTQICLQAATPKWHVVAPALDLCQLSHNSWVSQLLSRTLILEWQDAFSVVRGLVSWWLSGEESACYAGGKSSIPGLGRSLGEGNGNPLQYPCLENPMDRGAWCAVVYGVAKSWTRLKRLNWTGSYWTHTHASVISYPPWRNLSTFAGSHCALMIPQDWHWWTCTCRLLSGFPSIASGPPSQNGLGAFINCSFINSTWDLMNQKLSGVRAESVCAQDPS